MIIVLCILTTFSGPGGPAWAPRRMATEAFEGVLLSICGLRGGEGMAVAPL